MQGCDSAQGATKAELAEQAEGSLAEQRRHAALAHAIDVVDHGNPNGVVEAARHFEAYLDGGAEKGRIAVLERALKDQHGRAFALRDDLERAVRLADYARARLAIEIKVERGCYVVRGLSHYTGGSTVFRCDKRVPFGQFGLAAAVVSVERELQASSSAARGTRIFGPLQI